MCSPYFMCLSTIPVYEAYPEMLLIHHELCIEYLFPFPKSYLLQTASWLDVVHYADIFSHCQGFLS